MAEKYPPGGAANPLCADDMTATLDKLRAEADKAKVAAEGHNAENDSLKQDAVLLDADTKQLEQTVKEYLQAYKGLVEDRGKIQDDSEDARKRAKAYLPEDVRNALRDCFNLTLQKPEYQLPNVEQLKKDADDARAKYEDATLARDQTQREFDALKAYGKRQQGCDWGPRWSSSTRSRPGTRRSFWPPSRKTVGRSGLTTHSLLRTGSTRSDGSTKPSPR